MAPEGDEVLGDAPGDEVPGDVGVVDPAAGEGPALALGDGTDALGAHPASASPTDRSRVASA